LLKKKIVEKIAVKLLELAATRLPRDVKESLQKAYSEEESKVGRAQLKAMLKNMEFAEKMRAHL